MTEQKNTQTGKRHIAVAAASPPLAPRNDAAIPSFDELPDSALLRQSQFVRHPKHPTRPVLLPLSLETPWRKVADGSFPKPMELGLRTTARRVKAVHAWMDGMEASARADADGGAKE